MGIYLTPRERAMEIANREGYRACPYDSMPEMYKNPEAKHLAEAWTGGWNVRLSELKWNNCYR